MHLLDIAVNYVDSRGVISDLIVDELNSVTLVTFEAGAVRGNHIHHNTTQWKFVISGRLTFATLNDVGKVIEFQGLPGQLWVSYPGEPHAMRAEEKTEILVFTKGPRSGSNYDSDTEKVHII